MILIITHKDDFTCDYIIHKLNQRDIKYKRFNCEDVNKKTFSIDQFQKFSFENETAFSSVWFRRTKLPQFDQLKPEEQNYLSNEYESLLKNLFSIIDSKWLSDPYSIYKAENKLYQLKIAKEIGFQIPNTLVTNSKTELKQFYLDNNKNVIIKPLSQSRIVNEDDTSFIFTNILKEEHIENLDDFDLTPCIFQNKIEKEIELRITMVGDKIFAAYVDSQKDIHTQTDWRKGRLKFSAIEIPEDLSHKCLKLLEKLNLRFGAIDLIKTTSGDYIFLEINPNGQWVWIETDTNLQISDAIINELI